MGWQSYLSQMGQVIGQAWETSDEMGTTLVKTAVALNPHQSLTAELLLHSLQVQQTQIDELRLQLTCLAPVG